MRVFKVIAVFCSLFYSYQCSPVYPVPRWYDYDDFPVARPIETGTSHVVETLSPLRPYEPWIIECTVFIHNTDKKKEEQERHEQCQEIDDKNEKDYALYLVHISQWEEQYPDRATRWNARFPDAKDKEKKKYQDLKALSDYHKKLDDDAASPESGESSSSSSTTTSTQRSKCPMTCEPDNNDAKKGGSTRKKTGTT